MAIDGSSRVYIAWAERGFATRAARVLSTATRASCVATTTDAAVLHGTGDGGQRGARASGHAEPRLRGRQTDARLLRPARDGGAALREIHRLTTDSAYPATASARPSTSARRSARPAPRRHSRRRSRCPTTSPGFGVARAVLEQLQINPPNLPMFKLGTVPFIGDYIDVTPTPAFVPAPGGRWVYNTAASATFPVFHATWTDNRDVRAPLDGNWANYTPPTIVGSDRPERVRSVADWSPSVMPATPAHATRTSTRRASAAACWLARRATPSSSRPRCSAASRCSRTTRPRRRRRSA